MAISIKCKLCRISKRRGDILFFVNHLLDSGKSLRQITKLTFEKYQIYISKSSVAIHKSHYLNPKPIEENIEYYSAYGTTKVHY
jgi:hypothetical protein